MCVVKKLELPNEFAREGRVTSGFDDVEHEPFSLCPVETKNVSFKKTEKKS